LVPLVIRSWGAPLGEPVADDFDCLHRAFFQRGLPLFDGYGSAFYWRPLSRQVYFGLLAPLMVTRPVLIAALHVALLALTAIVLYRALRSRLGAPLAALAASFPLVMESTRMLIAWPSNFQDLGAILFAALAIHEATAARPATTLAAIFASLLCKELIAPAALLLAWLPQGIERRARVRWLIAIATLVASWGVAYAVVHARAHLMWPRAAPSEAALSWLARLWWARTNGLRAAFSLQVAHAPYEWLAIATFAAIVLASVGRFALHAPSRARLRTALPWVLGGAAWFVAGSAVLASTWPVWSAYRGIFATMGLGVALTALLGAAHPALAGAMLTLRLVLFAASPGPPRNVTGAPPESGALLDFAKLTRVQRLVGDTRRLLQSRFPALPSGAKVGQHNLPRMTEYAFLGDRALQVWYRDSTLRWVRFEDYSRRPSLDLAAIVEYQPDHAPQVALVDPGAMRALLEATDAMRHADWAAVATGLDRADSLQRDPDAVVFRATVGAKRAVVLLERGASADAECEARRALALWRDNFDSRYVLASVWRSQGRLAEAEAQLDTLLRAHPGDSDARLMLEQVRAARARPGG